MRAYGRRLQFLLRKLEATLQAVQAVLKVGQMLTGHEFDGREPLQVLEALIDQELGLALVVVHTQPGLGVHAGVCLQVRLLEIGQLALGLLPERGRASQRRVGILTEDFVPLGLHSGDPGVFGGQNSFGSGEIRGRGPKVAHQFLKGLGLGKRTQSIAMTADFLGVVTEILELAGRIISLKRFQEDLGFGELAAEFSDFVVGQHATAPEEQAALQGLVRENQPLNGLFGRLYHLLHGRLLALRDKLHHARRQAQQLE